MHVILHDELSLISFPIPSFVKQEEDVKQYSKDVNICELICEFAKYGIPSIELIFSGYHHIKPRQYLISSSPTRNRNVENIIVMNHNFGVNNKRHGLCISFLDRPKLRNIPIGITKSSFEIPEDGRDKHLDQCFLSFKAEDFRMVLLYSSLNQRHQMLTNR